MKLNTKKFIAMLDEASLPIWYLACEIGMTVAQLKIYLSRGRRFDYDQTKTMLNMFGAEEMAKVIDWEGMHVSCPI